MGFDALAGAAGGGFTSGGGMSSSSGVDGNDSFTANSGFGTGGLKFGNSGNSKGVSPILIAGGLIVLALFFKVK